MSNGISPLNESKENNDIEIELGQIIKLIAPENSELNEKTYYIKYLDENKIKLFDPYTNTLKSLNLENGNFADESIVGIEILYEPEKKGFARQNGLNTGVGISIEFGGRFPQIVNGEITNLEEDMIELTMVNREKIYIDFQYQGIPEQLEIVSIKPFDINIDEDIKVDKEDEGEVIYDEDFLDVDGDDENLFDYEQEFNESDNLKILNEGLNIIEGQIEDIDVDIEFIASEKNKRFSLKKQIDSLLDDLLSRIPNSERSKEKIAEINKNIIRFKELRTAFSNFEEDGNIENPKYKHFNKDYRPLIEQLKKINQKLLWMVPIIGNRKKIYDIDFMETTNDDYIVDTTDNFVKNFMNIREIYKDNVTNVDDKYIYLEQNLNNLQKNYLNLENKNDVIQTIEVYNDVECFVENFDNISSSAYKEESIHNTFNYKQVLTKGKSIILKDPITKVKSKMQIIEPEKINLKGFVIRSDNHRLYSELFLPEKNIYNKSNLNTFYSYKSIPENFDFENVIIDENYEQYDLELNNSMPYKITYNDIVNYDERNKEEVFDKFLSSIIPNTNDLIKKIHKNNRSTSIYDYVNNLECFSIKQDDIHFNNYQLINKIIDRNINNYKKLLATREKKYLNVTASRRNETSLLERIFTNDDSSLIEEVRTNYNLNVKYTNLEVINKIIQEDGGSNITLLLSKVLLPLSQDVNYDQKIEEELQKIDRGEKEDIILGDCKQVIIAKKYTSIEDLKRDNNDDTIIYDREYDNTRYDIMEDFESDMEIMKPEALQRKIVEHLINAVGVNEKDAARDSKSMISGRKLIEEGEFAILDLGEYEYRYYERKSNVWRLNEEYNDKMPDDALFCNLKQKCLAIKDKCSTLEKHTNNIEKSVLNKIAEHFSQELITLQERKKSKLTKLYTDSVSQLNQLISFNQKQKSKKDAYMINIAKSLEDIDIKISPYFGLRDEILAQNDIVKKFSDIIIFIDKYCRQYEKVNPDENIYWFYCIESGAPLLPTFFQQLAESIEKNNFSKDDYEITVEKIVKNRGKLSDDGDKIVDKYSGYLIKLLEFDTGEGYDKNTGYKMITREVIEEDEGDKMTSVLENKDNSKTSMSNLLEKMFKSMSKNLGIHIDSEMEFLISSSINLIENNIKTRNEYNKIIAKKTKNSSRSVKQYEEYYDQLFILCIISVFIVSIQSVIPRVKYSKTIPGCIVSFSGYPLESETSKKNIINYVICSILKYKNDSRPWKNGLPRIKNISSTKDVQRLENYYKKVKNFIEVNVLIYPDIEAKLIRKRKWVQDSKLSEEKTSDTVFSLKRWVHFSPPLYKIEKIKDKVPNISSIQQLLKKTITTGSKKQNDIINLLHGASNCLSTKILDIINKVVSRKELLFITNSGIPYLENSCCNDDSGNVYDYFVKNESGTKINRYNENVRVIREIIERINNLGYSGYLFTEEDTKQKHIKVEDNITEETIYKAFIKYCKYNTGLSLDPELSEICENNTAKFNKFDTIEEKISILKNENGTLYNTLSLMSLMKIINKRNEVKLSLDSRSFTNTLVFNELLEGVLQERIPLYDNDLFGEILRYSKENVNNFYKFNNITEGKITSKQEKSMDFLNLIDNKIVDYKETITSYLTLANTSSSTLRKINNFIDKMEKYNIENENIYMSSEDSKNYFIGQNFKLLINSVSSIIPEIIINQVDYSNKYIPKHWKLGSQYHERDVKEIIKTEFSGFEKYYGNSVFSRILENVIKITQNIRNLTNFVPFNASREMKPMFSSDVYCKILKVLLLKTLVIYTSITDRIDMEGRIEIKESVVELSELDQVRREANIQTLKSKMSNYIVSIFNFAIKKKKTLNVNKDKIKKNVLKSKIKEKNIITERLRNMTVEQRQIENLKKNHKLGDWNIGQTRAIFEYDENQYDKERNNMEKRYQLELKLGLTDDVSLEQRDIYMMEHLEEKAIDKRIEQDELILDMRDEGERDGENEW